MTTPEPLLELAECRSALRAIALELSRAEDQERQRIARELHDDLGQSLAAVQLHLADLARAGTEEARRSIIEVISQLVSGAIESSRTLTFELSAPVMPEVGIEGELERLTARLTERHRIPCQFSADSEPKPLTPEVALTLLRVGRELLFNITKHSQADKASVAVAKVGDRIRVTVSDNGIGFQPSPQSAPEQVGFGLLIVGERMAEIGGDVEFDSSPEEGTRVVVTAPLLVEGGGTR